MTQPYFVSTTTTTAPTTTTTPSTIAASNITCVAPAPTPTSSSSSSSSSSTVTTSSSSSVSSLPHPLQSPSSLSSSLLTSTAAATKTFTNSSSCSSGGGSSNKSSNTTTTTLTTTTTTTSSNNNNNNTTTTTTTHGASHTNIENNRQQQQQQHHHYLYNHFPPQFYHHHHNHQYQHQRYRYRYQQYNNNFNNYYSKFYGKPFGVRRRMENTYGCSVGAVASVTASGVTAEAASTETDNNCSGLITEAGVDIAGHYSGAALSTYERTGKSLHYNPKMAIAREFVFCTLGTFCSQRDIGSPPACLDALGGSGLAGIQWKKFLGKKAHVTITDRNNLDLLEANCYRNSMLPKELPIDYSRAPGLPLPHQLIDEIFVQQVSANVIMHLEAFDFIFIDAHGSCVSYLDAAFTNIRNNGLLCIVSSDLSALFAKTRHVAMRNYGANVIKNDYMKEAAVRVVIGAAAKSAAKCSKGIQVMFGVCVEPFVLVVIKVQRGPYYADMCSLKVRPLIHCQICEERAFCPEMRASVENLYDLLPCDCQSETPGKTALKLGPMWCDNIFNAKFVEQMISVARDMKLSERLEAQLSSIFNECICSSSPVDSSSSSKNCQSSSSPSPSHSVLLSYPSLSAQQHNERSALNSLKRKTSSSAPAASLLSSSSTSLSRTVSGNPIDNNVETNSNNNKNNNSNNKSNNNKNNNNNNNDNNTTTTTTSTAATAAASVDVGPATSENSAIGNGDGAIVDANASEMTANMKGAVSVTVVSTSSDPHGNLKMDFAVDRSARNCQNLTNEPPIKRICLPDPDPSPVLAMPPFFYNIHKRKFKGVFLPKLSKMVYLLQSEGFRASRTVFDTYGIRTNANQKEIYRTLLN
ncbi:TRMT1 [Octopus vulgaris]|uniref:TRMT1 n=1 Tax=Octopus vulgaris TaxID=6645 RepID=A0AA36BK70_OCTVU|nr:TRMT1 [Octopus vulgaris]